MKVVFHSNEAIQGDGFHAVVNENCGGVFDVTTTAKVIQSPLYPNFYPKNLYCNYTLVAPGKTIVVDFTDFELERSKRIYNFIQQKKKINPTEYYKNLTVILGRRDCRFDNLTIVSQSLYSNDEETYCGDDKPPITSSVDKIEMIFRTDKYVQRIGFSFNYFLSGILFRCLVYLIIIEDTYFIVDFLFLSKNAVERSRNLRK